MLSLVSFPSRATQESQNLCTQERCLKLLNYKVHIYIYSSWTKVTSMYKILKTIHTFGLDYFLFPVSIHTIKILARFLYMYLHSFPIGPSPQTTSMFLLFPFRSLPTKSILLGHYLPSFLLSSFPAPFLLFPGSSLPIHPCNEGDTSPCTNPNPNGTREWCRVPNAPVLTSQSR